MQNLTHLIGHTLITLDSVDSTNNYIANHAELDNMAHGTVVVAHQQTAGRGRFNRKWEVIEGLNLTFSYLLKPLHITSNDHLLLSKIAAISVCEWIKKLGLSPLIKLPNDILINKKKIAGILIENKWQGKELKQQIVGIGINVNQEIFDALYKTEPTSVKIESGIELDLETAIYDLLAFLSHYYTMLHDKSQHIDQLFDELLIKDYIMDDEDQIRISGVRNNGTITYFDDNGLNHEKMIDDLKLRLLP